MCFWCFCACLSTGNMPCNDQALRASSTPCTLHASNVSTCDRMSTTHCRHVQAHSTTGIPVFHALH